MIVSGPEIAKANRQEVERLPGRPPDDDAALSTAAKAVRAARLSRRR